MQSPLALVFDDDPQVRRRAQDALARAGIESVAAETPKEALELLRAHPLALVILAGGVDAGKTWPASLVELIRLRAGDAVADSSPHITGRSQAADTLRQRVLELASRRIPVLFSGEAGSGRRHAARCLHALSNEADPFTSLPAGDRTAWDAALRSGRGTVFLASIERLPWTAQESLATALASGNPGPRIAASIGVDPGRAVDEGRLSPRLLAAFSGAIVPVPPLRERRADVAVFVRAFVDELRTLNRLPEIQVAPQAMAALERFRWPGNLTQLRNAVESSMMLASDGTVRLTDLPEQIAGAAAGSDSPARADRRFREAKRVVVDAFERSYLQDLLRRNGGNVTGAAEQSGMLRSALQRLLRKHEIHSADFRGPDDSGPFPA